MGRIRTWAGTRPLVLVALFAAIFHVTNLPARAPVAVVAEPDRPAPPVEKPSPAPVALNPDFVVKRILNIDHPFRHGDYVWDDAGVPAGPIVITVDVEAQTLSVFRGGYEIGAAVILYGAEEKPTPEGVFPITEKDADHVSNLYDAPMPYMLRLTNDGVAIHGSKVEWGWATHGCIGVPIAFAAKLFAQAKIGDRVIITNGKRLQLGEAIIAG
ncbi:L,D-transpeptidase family protein [Rhizorhapis sp. SPR117]|uniref:L,D-transpeptidase family protein n=1 Tax=Rhizorhapis sp. SPR117 TaxID=2912611 RepID=UPI001F02092C